MGLNDWGSVMRSRILIVSRDIGMRARLARTLTGAGYGVELAESAAQAQRMEHKGLALAIVAPDGREQGSESLIGELRGTIGKVLFLSPASGRQVGGRMLDASEEADLLARVAQAL